MQGRGNYAPQYGQVPRTPVPPYQQYPRPPPPLHQNQFHQGTSMFHQGTVGVPPTGVGIGNREQSYLQSLPPPPRPIDGTAPASHKYANAQQNIQYHSHSVTQSMHHVPPPLPSLHPHHPEALHASSSHSVLPPHPLPPFHLRPPPRPLDSSILVRPGVQLVSASTHPVPTLPLPDSSPPIQPAPPPSICPESTGAKLTGQFYSGPSTVITTDPELRAEKPVDIGGYDEKDKSSEMESSSVAKELSNSNENKVLVSCSPSTQKEEKQCGSHLPSMTLASAIGSTHEQLVVPPLSHSPAGSDMEMEDDITQPDGSLGLTESAGALNSRFDTVHDECDVKDQLCAPKGFVGGGTENVSLSRNISYSGYPAMCDDNNSSIERSYLKVDSPVREAAYLDKHDSNGLSEKSSSNLPEIGKGLDSRLSSSEHVRGGNPIRLLQDYASDDETENVKVHVLQDVSPTEVPPRLATATLNLKNDPKKFSSESNQSYKIYQFTPDPSKEVKGVNTLPVDDRTRDARIVRDHKTQSQSGAASREDCYRKDVDRAGNHSRMGDHKPLKKVENMDSASLRFDEFGRLAREDASDSDSDEERFTRRGKRVRHRSRTRSRSPVNRSRTRWRSPRRRRERRSYSRSRSPRNRRSRSRSPVSSRMNEFRGNNSRRDKIPECFDFIKGTCHRGEACRFRHHDPDKAGVSGRHRSRQHVPEFSPDTRSSGAEKKVQSNRAFHPVHDLTNKEEGKVGQVTEDAKLFQEKENHVRDYQYRGGSECHNEMNPQVHDLQSCKVDSEEASTRISNTKLGDIMPSVDHADEKPVQKMDDFSLHYPSHDEKPIGSSEKVPPGESNPNRLSHYQPVPSNSVQQVSPFPSQSVAAETVPYMVPERHPHFPLPPSSWTPLPPPPPPRPLYDSNITNAGFAKSTSQIQSGHFPLTNDIRLQSSCRLYETEFTTHHPTGVGYRHGAHLPVHGLPHSFSHGEDVNLQSLPLDKPIQQYGEPNIIRDDCSGQLSMQGLTPSKSLAPDRINVQAISSSRNVSSEETEGRPPDDHLKSYFPVGPEQQLLSYSHQYHAVDSVGVPGTINYSMPGYTPNLPPRNHPSHPLGDFGGLRIAAHQNPYASTFEKPLNSRFSTNIFRKENDAPIPSQNPLDREDVGSFGSRQTTSSPNVVGKALRAGGDQYDPLIDSIEPSANSSQKLDHMQKLERNDSEPVGLSGSNKPMDVEEDNRKKEVRAVSPNMSMDNDEFGETADVEVGAVENESLSDDTDAARGAAGEVEIDQVKSSRKKRKSKDSRSMKLFRVALANFVKDVLKPSWRQGNMSKEAFKTIVKKTVDKVSAAMKRHQIPKSKAKIDHYINSSQRKLTKLVMGYVDKYVKV